MPGELYNAFEVSVPIGESLIPLSDIMDAWTNNAGYPVVKVDRDEDGITFSQVIYYNNNNLVKINALLKF